MGVESLMYLLTEYTYLIMAPAVFLFGPVVSLVAGVLLRLDAISIVPTCLAIAAGELSADVLWYWLGRWYGESFVRRFGRYVGINPGSIGYVKSLFAQHHDVIIFASKLTAGFGFAVVVLILLSLIGFGRYLRGRIAAEGNEQMNTKI